MLIAHDYVLDFDEVTQICTVKGERAPMCPDCGQLRSGYDSRMRSVIGSDGQTYRFLLRRLRCPKCKRLHLEIPDIIMPQKHYSASVIRQAIHNPQNACPADDSTIRRWRK